MESVFCRILFESEFFVEDCVLWSQFFCRRPCLIESEFFFVEDRVLWSQSFL